MNDAAALVLYRAGVVAAVTGTFVLKETLWLFVLAAAGGVAIGLAVGYVTREAARDRVRFEQFFTPQLAERLRNDEGMLRGREAEVTVLF